MNKSTPKKLLILWAVKFGVVSALVIVSAFILLPKIVLFEKYKDIILTLDKVSQKPYSQEWKCLDFSQELATQLEEKGIKSKIEIVKKEGIKNEYHAVISLQIDPQNGELTDYEVVDSCVFQNGEIKCEKGTIEGKNLYVALKAK